MLLGSVKRWTYQEVFLARAKAALPERAKRRQTLYAKPDNRWFLTLSSLESLYILDLLLWPLSQRNKSRRECGVLISWITRFWPLQQDWFRSKKQFFHEGQENHEGGFAAKTFSFFCFTSCPSCASWFIRFFSVWPPLVAKSIIFVLIRPTTSHFT